MPPPGKKPVPKRAAEQAEAERRAADEAARRAADDAARRTAADLAAATEAAQVRREAEALRRREELDRLAREHEWSSEALVAAQLAPTTATDGGHGDDPTLPDVDSDRELNTFLAGVLDEVELGQRLHAGRGGGGGGASLLLPPAATRRGVAANSGSSRWLGGPRSVGAEAEVPSPLRKGLHLATRLLRVSRRLERSLARAIEWRDAAGQQRAAAYIARVRDLAAERVDALTWALLQRAHDYGAEEGGRPGSGAELLVADAIHAAAAGGGFGGGGGDDDELQLILWAHLGPRAAAARAKVVQAGMVPAAVTGDAPAGLAVELPRQAAGMGEAVRVTRTAYDHAAGAAALVAAQEAQAAEAVAAFSGGAARRTQQGAGEPAAGSCGHAASAVGAPPAGSTVLGGLVVTVELLALPPPPVVTTAGTRLTLLSPLDEAPPFRVQRLPYPTGGVPRAGAAAELHAMRVRVPVPHPILMPERPAVARWHGGGGGGWVTAGVSDAVFDARTRALTFRTAHTGAHAVLQPRHADLPYADWAIHPQPAPASIRNPAAPRAAASGGGGGAVVTLRTRRLTFAIAVTGHGCCLLAPASVPELRHLTAASAATIPDADTAPWLQPGELLFALAAVGVNLMPQDADAAALKAARQSDYDSRAASRALVVAPASADLGEQPQPSPAGASAEGGSGEPTADAAGSLTGTTLHRRRGSDDDPPPSSEAAGGSPFRVTISGVPRPVPLVPKLPPQEDGAYGGMAALAAAFAFRASKWNAVPGVGGGCGSGDAGVIVVRAQEAYALAPPEFTRERGADCVADADAAADAALAEDGHPSAWRVLEVRRDDEAAGGARVTLVADSEADARAAWQAACTTTECGGPTDGAGGDLCSSQLAAAHGILGPETEPAARVYSGRPEPGAVAHASMRQALAPRSSHEALDAAAAADTAFVGVMARLLQLLRPLSFTQ